MKKSMDDKSRGKPKPESTELFDSDRREISSSNVSANPSEGKPHIEENVPLKQWAELLQNVSEIRDLIEKRLSRDKAKEEAFECLYMELDKLKREKYALDNKPLYLDLILLYDRIDAIGKQADKKSQLVLQSLKEEVNEILLRHDIELITTERSSFDPTYQRAICVESVGTLELDGKVLRVMRAGFTWGKQVIRSQEVVIGRFQSPTLQHTPEDSVRKKNEKI